MDDPDGGKHGKFGEHIGGEIESAEYFAGKDVALLADLAVAVENSHQRAHDDEHKHGDVGIGERCRVFLREGVVAAHKIDDDQHDGRLQYERKKCSKR